MDKVSVRMQVFFEEPFWVGLVERITEDRLTVSKITFGAEPKEYEVYQYILDNYWKLKFSPPVKAVAKERRVNPKRMQREAKRQAEHQEIGTKAQQALSLQREQLKLERKVRTREQKDEEKERMFALKTQKRKEKHRGR